MRVLHLNTLDNGGAGLAAIRLHEAMLKTGVESTLLTLRKSRKDIKRHFSYYELSSKRKTYLRYLNPFFYSSYFRKQQQYKYNSEVKSVAMNSSLEYISLLHSAYRIHEIEDFDQYDVINLHWIADFVDWPTFFPALKNKKVVWTLHDMAPFTGGYHYSGGYTGYVKLDEDAPFLKDTRFQDVFSKQLKNKIELFEKSNIDIKIIALSKWLKECSENSTLFKNFDHYFIPNTLDETVFRLYDKFTCRKELNLPIGDFICLFISENIDNKRKGFEFLMSAIKSGHLQSNIKFIAIGKSNTEIINDKIHFFGPILDQTRLATMYGAADIVIIPSIEDNLPNTALEAVFCGRPVVGFKIGGMSDLICDSSMGELSELAEKENFYQFIKNAVNKTYFPEVISKHALSKFGNKQIVESYLKVYSS